MFLLTLFSPACTTFPYRCSLFLYFPDFKPDCCLLLFLSAVFFLFCLLFSLCLTPSQSPLSPPSHFSSLIGRAWTEGVRTPFFWPMQGSSYCCVALLQMETQWLSHAGLLRNSWYIDCWGSSWEMAAAGTALWSSCNNTVGAGAHKPEVWPAIQTTSAVPKA